MRYSNARALVVEDDPSWQQILSEILSDAGLIVDVADNLESAVTSLRTAPHRLVVVDLSLDSGDHHNRDGLRVLDAVRMYDPASVPLLLTGYATVDLAVSALTEHGAFTCIRKEAFSRAGFRGLVQQILAMASPWSGTSPSQGYDATADGSPAGRAAPAPESSVGVALVVEDDAGWRSVLSELLAEVGYQVRQCNGFGEALGCLGRERYALAVVDLSLTSRLTTSADPFQARRQGEASGQDLDGYRLLASTQAIGIPTIVVSGVASPSEIESAYTEHGVFACLAKHAFDRHAFLRTVGEIQSADRIDSELDCLTDRERQVLALLIKGTTNKDIADTMMISTNTVKRHLKAIFEKLGVHTRAAAVAKALSAGLSAGWLEHGTGTEH
jgi:DNA-binding NarL/FixJ family response regulator